MPNPLDALKKAQTIGPEPQVMRAEMPLVAGGSMALKGLTSAMDLSKPTAKIIAERMFQQAHPVFKKLQEAGAFAGDRLNSFRGGW